MGALEGTARGRTGQTHACTHSHASRSRDPLEPTHLNSAMMASRSFCGMSPCIDDTVKLFWRIFSVSQSTLRLVLQKMTALGGGVQRRVQRAACVYVRTCRAYM